MSTYQEWYTSIVQIGDIVEQRADFRCQQFPDLTGKREDFYAFNQCPGTQPPRRRLADHYFPCDVCVSRPRAPVSNRSLYSSTLHQPPDPVNTALFPSITQVEIDLAIAINATGLQPELFDLPSQHMVYLGVQ